MSKYKEIYDYYSDKILTYQLKSGDMLPSIRKAAILHGVSTTTIQNAYFALQADGYIISQEKSGFYVSDFRPYVNNEINTADTKTKVLYDLKSGAADKESFDIPLWQRYIKSALRQEVRLLSYSEVQGEYDLREALSEYIRKKRNVITSPDRIVIGAGVQALLHILCSLIKERGTVSFPDNSFRQGIGLFKDYGFEVHTRDKNADIIYVSPSHMTSYGDVMPIKRRLELVKHSESTGALVIEDDYDSDFLYNTKPLPALYALSGGNNVVYMGSFSNVLIPGIRISYMVLTEDLYNRFKENSSNFAQTASKTEQIALCQYIRDGHILSQTRKIRRLYNAKTKKLYEELSTRLPDAKIQISDNGLQIKMTSRFNNSTDVFSENGLSVIIKEYENGIIKLILTPSALPNEEIADAVNLLVKLLKIKS